MNSKIGYWFIDDNDLPCFQYTGEIPFCAKDKSGKKTKLPDDPWFLLGNYQLTLFTHVSGEYEIITGQRAWGRVNSGKKPNSGLNRAVITIYESENTKETELTGVHSAAADTGICNRVFGCGFADYSYNLDDLKITRNLSVKPSLAYNGGVSAFLLTVRIKNTGSNVKKLTYRESVTANYSETRNQYIPSEQKKVKYESSPESEDVSCFAAVHTKSHADDPLLFVSPQMMSQYEGYPPSLFMKSMSDGIDISVNGSEIAAQKNISLASGESVTFRMIIGFYFDYDEMTVEKIVKEMSDYNSSMSAYSEHWLKIIPLLEDEKDEVLRREMRWNAYILEAMATYSHYYKETKIPQGTIYDYDWGIHAGARDNFQHALALVFYNRSLAKSVLRYLLKRTMPNGEILFTEFGYGYADNGSYKTSDQQLFFFLLLSEYLMVTKDYGFLDETVEYYPASGNGSGKVIDFVQNCFVFLRDSVGTGDHGLVRLLNSDWNDTLYYIIKAPYNRVYFSGESHMNTAMAISIFQTLIPQLETAASITLCGEQIRRICKSMSIYRCAVLEAFLNDMKDRTFPRRMYFDGKSFGDDNMFLEPMGYTLMINELSADYKKNLYIQMRERVYNNEKLGARQQQEPEFADDSYDKGSRENGGFWWALNGPVVLGVAEFDKNEAMKLLKNMTFDNYAKQFPEYWTSYWSASDNIESSLIPEEGLPDHSDNYACQPVFCAHPHAWVLYCYYRLSSVI